MAICVVFLQTLCRRFYPSSVLKTCVKIDPGCQRIVQLQTKRNWQRYLKNLLSFCLCQKHMQMTHLYNRLSIMSGVSSHYILVARAATVWQVAMLVLEHLKFRSKVEYYTEEFWTTFWDADRKSCYFNWASSWLLSFCYCLCYPIVSHIHFHLVPETIA